MKMFLRGLPMVGVLGAMLFGGAGTFAVPAFWAYLAILLVTFGATYAVLERTQPELVKERFGPPSDRDRGTRRWIALPLTAHYVIAGIDVGRVHWTSVPFAAQVVGFVLFTAGFGMASWTLFSNPFASSAVRIQNEREQRVISTGPYAIVRHPMYFGVVLCVLGSGLALGSWIATLLALPVIPIFVRRTNVEDRMLQEELPGYAEYTKKTRWKIVPGIY